MRDDAADGARRQAVVLHDAEDVVHPAELRVFDALIDEHAVVQLPVLPLIDAARALVSGHYADEFADAHGKQLVVRARARRGAAARRHRLRDRAGDARARSRRRAAAMPFDAASLTEDYELGLRSPRWAAAAASRGCRDAARDAGRGARLFPRHADAAVRQKARWMTGIALAGWDRTGWARPRATRATTGCGCATGARRWPMLVLAAAYLALMRGARRWLRRTGWPAIDAADSVGRDGRLLLVVNAALLAGGWRARVAFTGAGLWLARGVVVAAALRRRQSRLAARGARAAMALSRMLRGEPPRWDKTAHVFPDGGPARRVTR